MTFLNVYLVGCIVSLVIAMCYRDEIMDEIKLYFDINYFNHDFVFGCSVTFLTLLSWINVISFILGLLKRKQ
jgi:hypothetical protein